MAVDGAARPGVGELLREWRERALLTQEDVAGRAGISVRTVRRLERGDGARPQLTSIRLLADALDLDEEQRQLLVLAVRGPSDGAPPAATPVVGPRQLPADIETFAGRDLEVKALDNLISESVGATTVTIAVVSGTAGVGKTALAVHWAHAAADHFADGQLYLDLRGFGPADEVVEPAKAIRAFLEAWGVRSERIPASTDAQVGLYRSLTADKRVLVVLDNARDAAQVRPLLPGGPGCFVVVTSRSALTGLVVLEVAERGTDPVERARGYGSLARALTRLRSFEEARAHFVRASDLFDEAGDGAGLAITALNLGWLHDRRGDYARAGDHYRRAHDLFGAIDHRAGQCRALNGLGWARAHEGRLQDALDLCRDAFAGQEEIGDRFGQAETAETMGYAHRHLDEFALAEEWYERAGAIYAELGDRYNEATTLLQLGDVHRDTGNRDLARRRYRRALDILTELQHPDVQARTRLRL